MLQGLNKRSRANSWSACERHGQNMHRKDGAIGNNVNMTTEARPELFDLRRINKTCQRLISAGKRAFPPMQLGVCRFGSHGMRLGTSIALFDSQRATTSTQSELRFAWRHVARRHERF
jgi:hypothetical protein